jgi:hypothetical protein
MAKARRTTHRSTAGKSADELARGKKKAAGKKVAKKKAVKKR